MTVPISIHLPACPSLFTMPAIRRSGRPKDVVWQSYSRQKTTDGKGEWVGVCLGCGTTVLGLVHRLRQHVSKCSPTQQFPRKSPRAT